MIHKTLSFIILLGIINCSAMFNNIGSACVRKDDNDEVTWVTYFYSGPLIGTYSVIVRHSDNTEEDKEGLGSPKILFEILREMYNNQQKNK